MTFDNFVLVMIALSDKIMNQLKIEHGCNSLSDRVETLFKALKLHDSKELRKQLKNKKNKLADLLVSTSCYLL